MRAAVADFVYLTGWMAMCENQQGLWQRYYPRALELAGAAEDHVTYCRTLRGMSLQASHLEHVAQKPNGRPRKTLGWDTPAERLA
ncbi:hypothetical protein AB0K09_19065 [Streptomyces sp. NPDC049577]|uniref:hypothetical protein n=1 Tax=Streptomyces sp. NPDC049577 TaxID=3155153 RepID=UPI003442C865